jgi:fumarylacetoacetase
MSASEYDANDPELRSWLPASKTGDFPIQNLPYGVFRVAGEARPGVAIGDDVLDLRAVAAAGLLSPAVADAESLFAEGSLNELAGRGRLTWHALRARLSALLAAGNRELLDAGIAESAIVRQNAVELLLPVQIGDYVDFYSSLEHASNLGKILRPGSEPLLPNWRYLPVGYHGRSGTVVVSGTPVVRPTGQRKGTGAEAPDFGPSRMLDFELEMGFVTANGSALGAPVSIERARDLIFGLVLVNDWSARDIQAWEYQPLGPFLGKSFATSISPWIVSLEALEAYRVPGPAQEPKPFAYLQDAEPRSFDVALEVELASDAMLRAGTPPQRISHGNMRGLYWSVAQQLAHLTSNGATIRAGDLCASGTISGADPASYGSMIELTWRGAHPLTLADGSTRSFLEDGDRVVMRASCGPSGAHPRIGFGEVTGSVVPALASAIRIP